MNGSLLVSLSQQRRGAALRPHFGIHSLINVGELNNVPSLPAVTVATINRWMNS